MNIWYFYKRDLLHTFFQKDYKINKNKENIGISHWRNIEEININKNYYPDLEYIQIDLAPSWLKNILDI